MATTQPPLVADRYRLVEPLGQGGMGRVWRARDEVLHRDVAIKELVPPAGLTAEERTEMRERSLREARAIARLNHVNIVRIFDVLRTDGDPWIVMEYVASRSLQDVINTDGPVDSVRAAEIGLGMLAALRAAHRAGVVHRDVKPANVLLADDGRVVLTDWGLAIVPGDPNVTRTGLVLGSPAYIAPERARDGTAGPRSDLWSLGATLYAAVEGQSPFARPSAISTLAALASEPVPTPKRAGQLKAVLSGLLRKDPQDRIDPDAAERLLLRAAGRGPRRPNKGFLDGVRRPSALRERQASPPAVLPTPRPPADEAAAAAGAAALTAPAAPGAPASPDPAGPAAPVSPAAAASEAPAAPAEPTSGPPAAASPPPTRVFRDPQSSAPVQRPPTNQPPAHPATGSARVQPPTVRPTSAPPGRPGGKREANKRALIVAALALAAVVVAMSALVILLRDEDPGSNAAPGPSTSATPGTATASAAATPSGVGTATPGATGDGGNPSPGNGGAGSGQTWNPNFELPSGWSYQDDRWGFRVPVPDGWTFSRDRNGRPRWQGEGVLLLIDQRRDPQPDPVKDWENNEAARSGGYADYRRIRIEAVDYWDDAADWEWTYTSASGNPLHVLNRGFVTAIDQAYSIYWSTPATDWEPQKAKLQTVLDGFIPARR